MKTILYNPIFINPQAYYVFPRLTRYLQPDNESTAEPANYIGTIEVKVIAYGDTTLKRTYTNTDSIDLSEFKNTWIRISLFTKVGSCVLGEWKIGNMESDLPYIDPEVLASLKAVVIVGNKTNNDSDRAIVKNLVDPDNPFVISNASFKLNSGFGKYEEDFTSWIQTNGVIASSDKVQNSITGRFLYFNTVNKKEDVPSFKVNITLGQQSKLQYNYIKEDGTSTYIVYSESGIYTIPASYFSKYTGGNAWFGFYQIEGTSTIEQIPSFEGAFVTDGIDDLITSTKTVQEMLGGSNEITVVSMMANLDSRKILCNSNYSNTNGYNVRNTLEPNGVITMLGYTDKNGTTNNLNLIMGDKDSIKLVDKVNFNSDYVFYPAQYYKTYYQVAWYWTIIANKVLTTDQINQVIAYFNLDRTLNPDILCNTIKQGITNENHAEFGDKLIDFSGNGRDIQLNNIAWDGDSGIGKYNYPNWKVNVTQGNKYARIVYYDSINGTYSANFKGITDLYKSYGLSIEIRVNRANTVDFHSIKEDGIYTITPPDDTTSIDIRFGGENVYNASCDITITQIPSHAGALCLDGVNGFGKVTGMPIYKDYTFIIDYERISYASSERWVAGVVSKSHVANQGAFILMTANTTVEPGKQAYSFGGVTSFNRDDFTRALVYQSKYKCGDVDLTVGEGVDSNTLWLGTFRDNDQRFFNGAIYSLMSFPYSMSKFLIERQLKKYKLGTLYPDMVEFRPIVKSNASYDNIVFYYKNEKVENGTYLTVGSSIGMHIRLSSSPVNEIKSITVNGIPATFKYHDANNNIYQYDFNLTSKSPQNINITIDEYIRYEDIVQPYPILLRFNDENGNEVSWGGKFRVGSTITRIGSIADPESNLLNGLYSVSGLSLNGKAVTSAIGIVEKQMVFKTIATYLLDNNEPKCILSPRLLRIPNSSYKILGYIPDISGHGNHGVIYNSAYAEGSGVNEDGSYQFDGVDDFVTIPTATGGKQVFMKVNSRKSDCYLYDQRNNWTQYLGIVSTKDFIAYNYSNQRGKTYIDGILNENITANDLISITHNITVTNNRDDVEQYFPCIGTQFAKNSFAQMSLYDFMLFDNISTDDKIKELNEYVGIEAKVELPPYYWDAYGKTNLDGDKATIQQRGVAVGDYDLTNYNHAYEGMSGYNGYPVVFGANETWENLSSVYSYTSDVTSTTIHITRIKNAGTGLLFSYVKKDGALTNIREIPAFRVTVKGLEGNSKFGYRYLATEDATVETLVYLGNGTHELSKSFTPTEALLDLTRNAWVGIFITPMVEGEVVFDCDITIEVLPEYENGLVYDGVDDYSKNENIPVLTDYTIIAKRLWINKDNPLNEQFIHKGAINTPISESAFMLEYEIANDTYYRSSSYGGYINIERSNRPERIVYQTSNSYNGTSITKGSGTDTTGIVIGGVTNNYWNGVFYKLMLYSKTLPLLQINYLKNLMEKDEIIDLNNKIFIQE